MLSPPDIEFVFEREDSRFLGTAHKPAHGQPHGFLPTLDCPNLSAEIGSNLAPSLQTTAPPPVGQHRVGVGFVDHRRTL
jgi:hypothetical protein